MKPMRKFFWLGVVAALVACKVDEPAKKAAARTSGGSGGSAAPAATEGSAAPAPAPAGGEEEDTRPVPSCAEAIGKGLESFAAGSDAVPEAGELKSRMQAIYIRRCTEDQWPVAVLRCYAGTQGMSAMKLCRGRLPPEKAKKLQADIMSVMAGGTGGTMPPASTGGGPVPVGGPPAAPTN